MKSRRSFSDKVKFEIVLEVLNGQRTMAEIATQYEVLPTLISRWKKEFLEKGASVFASAKSEAESDWEDEPERLTKKIGEKEMELDFVKKLEETGNPVKRAMVNPALAISIRKQCSLLLLGRSSYYYKRRPVSDDDLKLMNRIDEIFTDGPEYGSRFIRKILRREDGLRVNRKRIVRLMRKMGICAIYPGKNTSVPGKRHNHQIFPYLLRGLAIQQPNHVWSTDITYIRMGRGFLHLVAVVDWATRRILS